MLTAAELADLRTVAALALPDRATITRRALAADGHLGQTETWTPIATDVPCRLVSETNSGNREGTIGSRMASTGEQVLRLRYGTALAEEDRIAVTIGGTPHTFDVVRVMAASTATALSVAVSEVR